MNNIKLVFDIDDTICDNKNRDYENAIPKTEVINKINNLHKQGAKITLYTSRGMVSCNGDIEKIIAKNKAILESWLLKNNVQYDDLIFGKPLGDMYIDDKCINVRDFVNQDFEVLKGKSGYAVIRLGNIVKKEMTDENYKKVKDWYAESKGIANSPKLISNLYSTIYMEYIDGQSANDILNEELLNKLIKQIEKFKKKKLQTFNKDKIYNKLDRHKSEDKKWNATIDYCKELIKGIKFKPTLSHGDFTLGNIIVKNGQIYLLDSLFDIEASNYLFDFAKLRMSLDNYEYKFVGGKRINKKYKKQLDNYLNKKGILNQVKILEFMYAIRLHNYNTEKEKVKKFAYERRKEIEI